MNPRVYITLPTGLFCLPMPNMQILSFIITQFLLKNIKVGIKLTLKVSLGKKSSGTWLKHASVLSFKKLILTQCTVLNSSWPSATYMRRDFQGLFPQRPRYGALISVLISPVPHTWGVTNGSLLASPPNSRRSPASLISPAPHICGASRTPILTRVVWKILNVVTNILVVLPDYRLP